MISPGSPHISPHLPPSTTVASFDAATAESWGQLSVRYKLEDRQLTYERLSEIVKAFGKHGHRLDGDSGEESNVALGFLFVYDLPTSPPIAPPISPHLPTSPHISPHLRYDLYTSL